MLPVMDLGERIARRRATTDDRFVTAWSALSPAAHPDDPVGRGAVLERLLDHLGPVFSGHLPDDLHVHGPPGGGKSAVVLALFSELSRQLTGSGTPIQTSTRAASPSAASRVSFVAVDTRQAASPFRLYRATLSALREESVPKRGVSTDVLRTELADELGASRKLVVALDHLDEPRTLSPPEARSLFDAVEGPVATVTIGPERTDAVATVPVPAYRDAALTEVLMARGSRGLRGGLRHEVAERLATWADGDAADALAALYGAAVLAEDAGRRSLTDPDLEQGMAAVPRDGVSVSRVLTLPENRLVTLDALLSETTTRSIDAVAEAVAAKTDLSAGTVTRFLYELAEDGVLERVESEDEPGGPSGVVPRFPTLVYRHLRA
jgi:Cdc6-like AAA superfamily ATPase